MRGDRRGGARLAAALALLAAAWPPACAGDGGGGPTCEDTGADGDADSDSDADSDADSDSDPDTGGEPDAGDTDPDPDGTDLWPIRITGWGEELVSDLAVSAGGDVALTGGTAGTTWFGEDASLGVVGEQDVWVAAYGVDGAFSWASRIGGALFDTPGAVAVLEDGTTVVVGQFSGEAAVGAGAPEATLSAGAADTAGFVAGFGTDGAVLWARTIDSERYVRELRVAPHPSGDFVVAAGFAETTTLGAGEANETVLEPYGEVETSYDQNDVLLARFAPSGDLVWARRATHGYTNPKNPTDLAVGPEGRIYLALQAQVDVTFGLGEATQTTLATDGTESLAMYAVFEDDGAFLWARMPVSENGCDAIGVAAASDGSLVASGEFFGNVAFDWGGADEIMLGAVMDKDAYVAKWGPTGELSWAWRLGGGEEEVYEQGGAVAIGPDDGVFLAGSYAGDVIIGTGMSEPAITAAGGTDAVAARCPADGLFDWATAAGGALADTGSVAGALPDGTYLMGGTFGGLGRFPDGEGERWLGASGVSDVFVARFRPE